MVSLLVEANWFDYLRPQARFVHATAHNSLEEFSSRPFMGHLRRNEIRANRFKAGNRTDDVIATTVNKHSNNRALSMRLRMAKNSSAAAADWPTEWLRGRPLRNSISRFNNTILI